MKKLSLTLAFIATALFAGFNTSAMAQSATQQKTFTNAFVDETLQEVSLPIEYGNSVVWQKIYAEQDKIVYLYTLDFPSTAMPLEMLEGITDQAATIGICENTRDFKKFTDLKVSLVVLYQFQDKTIELSRDASYCDQ